MAAHQHVGAAVPGTITPTSGNARWQAGVEGNRTADSDDFAAKLIATATARAALLGIEVHRLDDSAWLLRHARGGSIGSVRGLVALDAAVGGLLVQHMRGAT